MKLVSLQRLARHAYTDGTYSYHYSPVEPDKDDALVNRDDAAPAYDPADRFTDWPPQPMIGWLKEPQA